jgi:hypothetical protein
MASATSVVKAVPLTVVPLDQLFPSKVAPTIVPVLVAARR